MEAVSVFQTDKHILLQVETVHETLKSSLQSQILNLKARITLLEQQNAEYKRDAILYRLLRQKKGEENFYKSKLLHSLQNQNSELLKHIENLNQKLKVQTQEIVARFGELETSFTIKQVQRFKADNNCKTSSKETTNITDDDNIRLPSFHSSRENKANGCNTTLTDLDKHLYRLGPLCKQVKSYCNKLEHYYLHIISLENENKGIYEDILASEKRSNSFKKQITSLLQQQLQRQHDEKENKFKKNMTLKKNLLNESEQFINTILSYCNEILSITSSPVFRKPSNCSLKNGRGDGGVLIDV